MNERLIRLPEVMAKTGIKKSTVWDFVKKEKFPKPIKISARITVWREIEIDQYIASKIRA